MIGYYMLAFVLALIPVAAYLLYLAVLNGRVQPTLISGPWDFVGVLFATSAFWLIGGPMILYIFHERWRPALMHGEMSELASGDWSFIWLLPWLVYFIVVFGGASWLLRRRRAYTLVYNVEPPALEDALAQVLGRLGMGLTRIGNRVTICAAALPEAERNEAIQTAAAATSLAAAPTTIAPEGRPEAAGKVLAELDLDPFVAMRNVSIHWKQEAGVRADVEAELARQLQGLETPENPAAGWLLTTASCMFSAIFLGLIGLLFLNMRR